MKNSSFANSLAGLKSRATEYRDILADAGKAFSDAWNEDTETDAIIDRFIEGISSSSNETPRYYSQNLFCGGCGAELSSDSKFCGKCGRRVESIADSLFCSECGSSLKYGAKYCDKCGAEQFAVNQGNRETLGDSEDAIKSEPATAQNVEKENADETKRKIEYRGIVYKCAYCGEQIDSKTKVCPACGMLIEEQKSDKKKKQIIKKEKKKDYLVEFNRGLENLQKNRGQKKSIFDKTDYENLYEKDLYSYIVNYPIPNDASVALSFALLAESNISVEQSKVSFWTNPKEKSISNAWVKKLRQAYRCAEASFSHTPEYREISKLYIKKMRELNRPL